MSVKRRIVLGGILLCLVLGALFILENYNRVFVPGETAENQAEADNAGERGGDNAEHVFAGESGGPTVYSIVRNGSTEFLSDGSEEDPLESYEERSPAIPEGKFVLFIVLDDAGASYAQIEPYIQFGKKVSIAILPELRYSRIIAQQLQINRIPYLLHLPMQPLGNQNPGKNAIQVSHSSSETLAIVRKKIRSIPGIAGINNHMGSLATSNKRIMRVLLSELKRQNILFLDSRTSANSVASEVARELGMHIVERDIFIDNENEVVKIKKQIRLGVALAQKKGYAVLLGHVTHHETFTAISELYPDIAAEGGMLAGIDEFFTFVPGKTIIVTKQ